MNSDPLEVRKRLRTIEHSLEHLFQGVSILDGDLRLVFCNQKFVELLDFPEKLIRTGMSLEAFLRYNAERGEYGPGDIEAQVKERMDLARQRLPHKFERVTSDGTVLEIVGQPLPDGGFITTYTDITERRVAQDRLEQSTELLNRLLHHSPAMVAIRDTEGRFRIVNQAYERTLGVNRDEVKGELITDVLQDDYAQELLRYDREIITSGEPMIHEHQATRQYGGKSVLSVRFPIKDREGNITGVGAISTDITELKRKERELVEAKEKAEYANRAKSEFLAHMSHELRTPLNSVIGFSDTMVGEHFGDMSPRYKEYAGYIQSAGTHLLGLIDDILDVSKAEFGDFKLNEADLDVDETVKSTIVMASQYAADRDISIVWTSSDTALKVRGDLMRIKQVLLNLMANAIKYSKRDGREVRIETGLVDGAVHISVIDSGIGIAPADQARVFDPFTQVRGSSGHAGEGLGIGLYLSKRIMELHNGSLHLESEPHKGTTVTVQFPPERTVPEE